MYARGIEHSTHGVNNCLACINLALARGQVGKPGLQPWGLPVVAIDCATGENEARMRKDMTADMAEMLEQCGVKDVHTFDDGYFPGMGIHEMGTARMGRDPKTSVLNPHNQVWDVPNVFVTDGSCMTSSACQNPSLTYMALTARACHYAVEQMKRGEIQS